MDPFSFCMESCTLPTMVIARQHMWGVSPVGPYYLDKHGSTRDRVKHVRSLEPFERRWQSPQLCLNSAVACTPVCPIEREPSQEVLFERCQPIVLHDAVSVAASLLWRCTCAEVSTADAGLAREAQAHCCASLSRRLMLALIYCRVGTCS